MPDNSENLIGLFATQGSLLAAACPIEPTPDVSMLLSKYDVVTDEDTGMFFEMRQWGDTYYDFTNVVIESNWGRAAGVDKNLCRIVSTANS